ncbi:hypothetical protein CPB84DRAFT_1853085 [Gymnopilus junonius]|uniref:Transcription factor Iwr1 domain-containing protein n=1 Tax=Gymnopilus junonius TaxID=109634 RepID=A0A9P5NBA2_GYMJU|nr:hypothetical protein CPB84DRAFT_1853085 [Gymnopilus junonius]
MATPALTSEDHRLHLMMQAAMELDSSASNGESLALVNVNPSANADPAPASVSTSLTPLVAKAANLWVDSDNELSLSDEPQVTAPQKGSSTLMSQLAADAWEVSSEEEADAGADKDSASESSGPDDVHQAAYAHVGTSGDSTVISPSWITLSRQTYNAAYFDFVDPSWVESGEHGGLHKESSSEHYSDYESDNDDEYDDDDDNDIVSSAVASANSEDDED